MNQGRFIERTIQSVLSQSVPELEYVVVDGGSTDATLPVLRQYQDRLRWVSEPDRGQADALNKGIRSTSGEVIGWLNSDDLYYPGALEAVCRLFQARPDIDVLYGDAHHIDTSDRIIEVYPTEPWNFERLGENCFLCQPAVFFRRRVVEQCGYLDTSLEFCMDYEYWLRLGMAGRRFVHLPRPLAGSRMYSTNKTMRARDRVHAEIVAMLRAKLGFVPGRWIVRYACHILEAREISRRSHLKFLPALLLLSFGACFRNNRRIPWQFLQSNARWLVSLIGAELERPWDRLARRVAALVAPPLKCLETALCRARTSYPNWPPRDIFDTVPTENQLSEANAYCTRVALCDGNGRPRDTFRQGEVAHVFAEFEALGELAAPGATLEIGDGYDSVIHSTATDRPAGTRRCDIGTTIRFRHAIQLDLAAGSYWISLGLVSARCDPQRPAGRRDPEHDPAAALESQCRVQNVKRLRVRPSENGRLAHFGMVELPGHCALRVHRGSEPARAATQPGLFRKTGLLPRRIIRRSSACATSKLPGAGSAATPVRDGEKNSRTPCVFHVTHTKAGSQWIAKILNELVPERVVPPQPGMYHVLHWPIRPGGVYPTVYLAKETFETLKLPAVSRRFVVIRDLRDTLVSAYFSLKSSHAQRSRQLETWRQLLRSMEFEAGMTRLMDDWLSYQARIQLSWAEAGEAIVRYEDLLDKDIEIFPEIFIDQCELPVAPERVREVVLANRFDRQSGGRHRGQEDVKSHFRKATPGDWKNYLSDRLRTAFKNRLGGVLIATGYEEDLNW